MNHKPNGVHPDAGFDARRQTQPAITLAADVRALVASLGLEVEVTDTGNYEPDLFVRAVKTIHGQLCEARDKLTVQAHSQKQREIELARREALCAQREARIRAVHELVGTVQGERQRRRWFGR